jgi:hypothetical protein
MVTDKLTKNQAVDSPCAFCGKFPANTRDHIPPKGIFPRPRPNLITVPACRRCNGGTSKIEEEFKVYLSLRVGINNIATRKLWDAEAMRTLKHNPRLRNRILRSTETVSLRSPAGIILGERSAAPWPAAVHDPIIEKTIKGLYYYHYGEVLADRVQIQTQWFSTLEDVTNWSRRIHPSLEQLWTELPGSGNIGNEYFRYRYAKAIDSPLHSTWMFDFYRAHFTGGYTSPLQPDFMQNTSGLEGG